MSVMKIRLKHSPLAPPVPMSTPSRERSLLRQKECLSSFVATLCQAALAKIMGFLDKDDVIILTMHFLILDQIKSNPTRIKLKLLKDIISEYGPLTQPQKGILQRLIHNRESNLGKDEVHRASRKKYCQTHHPVLHLSLHCKLPKMFISKE